MTKALGRLSWRRFGLYAWGAAALLNLLVLAAFTVPRTLRQRNLERHAAELHEQVERAQERNRGLRETSQIAGQNEADVRRFYRGLVGTREQTLLPVLAEIDTLTRELRLNPGTQTYEAEPVKKRPLMRFRITVPVSGTYPQVVALLERLERSPNFVTVDEIKLRERPQEGAGTTELSLNFSTFFTDPKAVAAASESRSREARDGR